MSYYNNSAQLGFGTGFAISLNKDAESHIPHNELADYLQEILGREIAGDVVLNVGEKIDTFVKRANRNAHDMGIYISIEGGDGWEDSPESIVIMDLATRIDASDERRPFHGVFILEQSDNVQLKEIHTRALECDKLETSEIGALFYKSVWV